MERLTRSIDGIVGTDKAAMEVVLARGYPDAPKASSWSARRLAAVVGSLAVVLGGAIIAINLMSERAGAEPAGRGAPQAPRPPSRRRPLPPPHRRRRRRTARSRRDRRPRRAPERQSRRVVARPKAAPPPATYRVLVERLRRLPESAQRPGGQIPDRRPDPRRRDRHRARRVPRGGRQFAAVVPGDMARHVRLDLELLHRRREDRRAAEGAMTSPR